MSTRATLDSASRSAPRANGNGLGATRVAELAGITLRQLYYWERIGVVKPQRRRHGQRWFRAYSDGQVDVLRRVKQLVDEGYVVNRAAEKILSGPEEG